MTQLDKIRLLNEQDRRLAFLCLEQELKLAEIASKLGLTYRKTQKRVAALKRFMKTPEFIFVAENLKALPRDVQLAAESRYLKRMSQRDAARAAGWNQYDIQRLDFGIRLITSYVNYHSLNGVETYLKSEVYP